MAIILPGVSHTEESDEMLVFGEHDVASKVKAQFLDS